MIWFAARGMVLCVMAALSLSEGRAASAPLIRQHMTLAESINFAAIGSDRVYRSCRRQVRRAAGIIPGTRMRLPRAFIHLVDRCVSNGGIYS